MSSTARRVSAFGKGWPNGLAALADVPELFRRSRILLGIGTIFHCDHLFALKLRDFDCPMSGSFYLTSANPDLARVYEIGKEVDVYSTPEECAAKCSFYLKHPVERETIARAGCQRALLDHTWSSRFTDLFAFLRGNPSVWKWS